MSNSTRRRAPRPVTGRAPHTIGVLLAVLLTVVGFGAAADSAGASTRHTVHRTAVRKVHASVARSATVTAHATVRGRTVAATSTAKAVGRATARATGRASATAASTALARARAQHRAIARANALARKIAKARAARRALVLATRAARTQARTQAEQAATTLAGGNSGTTSGDPSLDGSTGSVTGDPTAGSGFSSGSTDSGTSTNTATDTSSKSAACGGAAPVKADGTRWTCTFDDEFNGTSLDATKWTAWNGYNYNGSPNTCYYDDPSHVRVSGGYLDLAVTKLATPQPCWTAWGWQNSQYGGAVVHTQHKFSQDGGLFEARIKFAGGTGLHNAFWLMPEYGKQIYPGHAEIDAAEGYGALPNTMFGNTHLNEANGPNDAGAVNACAVANWASGFHTYAIEWTAGKQITFLFDGVKCATFANWTALPGYSNSTPFDQPFFMILQTLADDGSFSPAPDASTVFPAITQVDYVRVWK